MIDKRKALILLSVVAVAVMISSIALTTYAADITANGEESGNGFVERFKGDMLMEQCGGRRGWGRFAFEVSEEYEANVISIIESDEDVTELLTDGYSVSGVRPVIKHIVEADGTVVSKATNAIVILEKDTTGYASVWVDLNEGKVTRIVIFTRTVIEKP